MGTGPDRPERKATKEVPFLAVNQVKYPQLLGSENGLAPIDGHEFPRP